MNKIDTIDRLVATRCCDYTLNKNCVLGNSLKNRKDFFWRIKEMDLEKQNIRRKAK
jgi:hypothetical protein